MDFSIWYKIWQDVKAPLIAIINTIIGYLVVSSDLSAMLVGVVNAVFLIADLVLSYFANKKVNVIYKAK